MGGESWEEHMIRINTAAKKFQQKYSDKKGSQYDLKATCGIEGPPAKDRIVGGHEAGQQWKQVGVVSFGASAGCEVGYPAGFTRTEYSLDWISQNTGIKY